MICFTQKGKVLGEAIIEKGNKHNCTLYAIKEGTKSLSQWVKEAFFTAQALVFIGATGIAVRGIAPYVESKYKDPAVLVIDEGGNFVISLLSGHIGQANALTSELAAEIGATSVITTATDINGLFAIDEWATRKGYFMRDPKVAQEVSSTLLEGKTVGVFCDAEIGFLPKELIEKEEGKLGILVSPFLKQPFDKTLHLVPKVVHLGMGCKIGTRKEDLEQYVLSVLEKGNIAVESIKSLATIDIKKEEEGLCELCKKYGWDMVTYTAEELQQAKGIFISSAFVKKTVGVDNVCERAGSLSSQEGTMIFEKKTGHGMTLSIWIEKWSVDFE